MRIGWTQALFSSVGLYSPGDLWPTLPVCVTSSLNCTLENGMPCVIQEPAPVHNRYSFTSLIGALLSLRACSWNLSSISWGFLTKMRARLLPRCTLAVRFLLPFRVALGLNQSLRER